MARPHITAIRAKERNMTEAALLELLTAKFSDQASMAREIRVSQPAISDALARHGYKNVCRWVRTNDAGDGR